MGTIMRIDVMMVIEEGFGNLLRICVSYVPGESLKAIFDLIFSIIFQ